MGGGGGGAHRRAAAGPKVRWPPTWSTSMKNSFVTSPRITSKLGLSSRSFTLVFCEVKKLSSATTSWPSLTSRRQMCEPRKPQPPVTRMRRKGSSFVFAMVHGGHDSGCSLAESTGRP
jgi:hypothetical protein